MKILFKFGLIMMLLLSGCQQSNKHIEPQPTPVEPKPEEPIDSKPIEPELYGTTELVKELAQRFMNHETEIDISTFDDPVDVILYSASEASTQNPMIMDFPVTYIENENPNILKVNYSFTKEELVEKRQKVWDKVTELVKTLDYESPNNYQKSVWLFDTITNLVEYDMDSYYELNNVNTSTGISNPDAHNAYGAFIKNLAVCEGYANAYAILSRAIGLETVVVNGTITQSNELHAWNRSNFDGDWVITDPTWGDKMSKDYNYLNRGLSFFENERTENMYGNRADLKSWPSTSDDYRMTKVENLIVTTEEAKELITKLNEQGAEQIYFEISDIEPESFTTWLLEHNILQNYPYFISTEKTIQLNK